MLTLRLITCLCVLLLLFEMSNGYHQIDTKTFRNFCGPDKFYFSNSSKPYQVSSVFECASLCFDSTDCSSFNIIKEEGTRQRCELFSETFDCNELSGRDNARYMKLNKIGCPSKYIYNGFECVCSHGLYGPHCQTRYKDCSTYVNEGITDPIKQILYIWPDNYPEPFEVKCTLAYGGITFIQDNKDGPLCDPNDPIDYFNRDWESYKKGFGDLNCKYWLGLDKMHALTTQRSYTLGIEIVAQESGYPYLQGFYAHFVVGSESQDYVVDFSWFVNNGNFPAGDSLLFPVIPSESIKNNKFSTFDRDNDNSASNCAADFHAGFWFNDCAAANPNGWLVQTSDGSRNTSVPSILWKHDWGHKAISRFIMKLS